MNELPSHVVNVDEVPEVDYTKGGCWGGLDKPLTPSMRAKGGRLGVNLSRLPRSPRSCVELPRYEAAAAGNSAAHADSANTFKASQLGKPRRSAGGPSRVMRFDRSASFKGKYPIHTSVRVRTSVSTVRSSSKPSGV